MQIMAAVARGAGAPFTLESLELEAPRTDEVLVRIVSAGVCHTDLAARDQAIPVGLPVVLGHEGAGIVEQVGSAVSSLKAGDAVALSFASCGACPSCAAHTPGYCASFMPLNFGGARADGSVALSDKGDPVGSHFFGQSSFASHAVVNQRNAIKVHAEAPLELLGPLGCGIQTGAGSVMQALACAAGSSLLILGAGSVGLSAVLGAVIQQCATIIVLEPHVARRAMALELGATHALDPAVISNAELGTAVRAIVAQGVNTVLDTTGRATLINASVAALAYRGTIGVLGVPASADDASLAVDVIGLLGLGYRIKGITEGDVDPVRFIPRLVDMQMDGRFPFDKLITRYPLAQINDAIDAQHRGSCIKPVLIP